MLQIRRFLPEAASGLFVRRRIGVALALLAGLGCLIEPGMASAAESAAGQLPIRPFPVAQVFTFLFLMLGPFKIIHPFATMTAGADPAQTRQIALWGTLFASLALLLAAVLGERILASYGIPLPVLALAAGIILFLVALLGIVQQFMPSAPHAEDASGTGPVQPLKVALSQLAFPTIVTPYGIAALVVFFTVSEGLEAQLTIGGVVLAIMLLNLAVMLAARRVLPVLGVVLPILGAVLGVVQVALGLQIIHNSLKAIGLI